MSPHRRALTVALLLLVAGCSGAPLDGGEGLNAGAPSLDAFQYPDGYDADGVSNVTLALETHNERLAATGGMIDVTRTYDGGEADRTTVGVDADDERVHRTRRRGDEIVRESFYRNGTIYHRTDHDDDVRTREATYRNAVGDAGLLRTIEALDFSAAGTTVVDGTAVVRYEATEIDRRTTNTADDAESVSGELLVDGDGMVHRFEYRVVIDEGDGPRTFTGSYVVEGDGDTWVDVPDWVSDAETGNGGG